MFEAPLIDLTWRNEHFATLAARRRNDEGSPIA
jgi:hypothetical protein